MPPLSGRSPRRRAAVRAAALAALLALQACDVSDADERQMGEEYSRELNAKLPLVTDLRVTGYVNALGRDIASRTSRANLDWQFFVVNSREVNAFALPGGFVYVNRGLIDQADRMDELAGVLGHEIGHVVERHSIDQMQKATGANIFVRLLCSVTDLCSGVVSQVVISAAGNAILAKYSRDDEIRADSQAVVNVINAGIDPEGVPAMFDKLREVRQRQPGLLDAFFASHPIEETRVERTRALIASLDPASLKSLTRDDVSFHKFQQVVASLPPPPPTQQISP